MRPPIDVMERAQAAIDAGTEGQVHALLRPIEDGAEGVTLRHSESSVRETYMDQTQEIAYLFDVICRRRREDMAFEEAQVCSWAIQREGLASANGSYEINSVEEYAGPTEVGLPSDGMHTVRVGMRAILTTRP